MYYRLCWCIFAWLLVVHALCWFLTRWRVCDISILSADRCFFARNFLRYFNHWIIAQLNIAKRTWNLIEVSCILVCTKISFFSYLPNPLFFHEDFYICTDFYFLLHIMGMILLFVYTCQTSCDTSSLVFFTHEPNF